MRRTATNNINDDARTHAAPTPLSATFAIPRPARGAALWASIGFVSGAVFWHAVGFWTFMSDLMLDSREAVAAHAPGATATTPVAFTSANGAIETGSLPTIHHVDPTHCISLEIDRVAGRTAARPCPAEGMALRLQPSDTRSDLVVLAETGDQ